MLAVGVLDTPAQTVELFDISPAVFIENRGQWADDSIRYALLGNGANVLHTDTGPVFQLVGGVSDSDYVGGVSEAIFWAGCPRVPWAACLPLLDHVPHWARAGKPPMAPRINRRSHRRRRRCCRLHRRNRRRRRLLYKHHVLDAIRGGGDDYAGRF